MSSPPRYLCIHGHFYQPPRENPWLGQIPGRVEEQPSAAPYHDWNHRVSAECYAPNASARILDDLDRIVRMVNNYERISFNFGPTLLAWMAAEAPEVYDAVLRADALSRQRSGFGNAMAQVYNHVIMPLATRADKRTQVRWGIDDFVHRFGRRPEGMWLAETAADTESLQVLAEQGIRFTVLAPHQAAAVRPLQGDGAWIEYTGGDGVDPTRPYLCRLPDDREITLFFYDGPISRAIAFEGALRSGARFLERLRQGFSDRRDWPQILTIAVDGETFGHHSRFGEMALAWVLDRLRDADDVRLTNFSEFLSLHPPTWEARLRERTSWSCAHGVERWRDDCGCTTGGQPGWTQAWRRPLREALDWLEERLNGIFGRSGLFRDPVAARDDYHAVLLEGGEEARRSFLERHLAVPAGGREQVRAWKALEMQRCALLMFTSCAWFFDDISRIEPRQVLAYAARALQLALDFDKNLEPAFVERLRPAESNVPEMQDGAYLFRTYVRPLLVDLSRVVAHSAIVGLALGDDLPRTVYCYDVEPHDHVHERVGGTALSIGRVTVRNRTTGAEEAVSFCVVHFGGHDFHCAVRGVLDIADYERVRERLLEHYRSHSVTEVIRTIDESFGLRYYTLRDLFQEERKNVLYQVSDDTLRRTEAIYRRLYEENRQLMAFARETSVEVLRSFRYASSFVLGVDIRRALGDPLNDKLPARLTWLAEEAARWGAEIESEQIAWRLRERLEEAVRTLARSPNDARLAHTVDRLLDVSHAFDVTLDLSGVQTIFHGLCVAFLRPEPEQGAAEASSPPLDPIVRRRLAELGLRLGFHPDICAVGG